MGVYKEPIEIGTKLQNNKGSWVEVISYKDRKSIVIRYLDEYNYTSTVSYSNLKAGKFKSPYEKTLRGIGYLGEGIHERKNGNRQTRAYTIWAAMIARCYCYEQYKTLKTYKGCTVCEKWHNFQSFAEWYYNQIGWDKGFQLDKDLLVEGNKIYSPETCCLVPKQINTLLVGNTTKRSETPVGVSFCKKRLKYLAETTARGEYVYLGYFSEMEDAIMAYKTAKEGHVKEIAKEYKEMIPNKVYDNLMSWKVECNNKGLNCEQIRQQLT